jgi:NACHT domain
MADPLSVASGVAGLITLAGSVISKCYTYGCAVSGAPKEMKSLVDEVTNLSGLLVGLQGLVKADRLPAGQKETVTRTVDDCKATLGEILDTLDQVKPASTEGKLGKTVKRLLWPLKREQTLALVHRLDRQRNTLAFALSTGIGTGVYETQIILADVQIGLQKDRVERRTREALEQRRKVLQWLSDVDYEVKHTRASDLQHPGIGSWLLKNPRLQSWIEGDISFLWIYGIPGSGKTVWTSIILNHCIFPRLSDNLFAAFFYFDFRDVASEKPENALGAIIAQLCKWLDPFPSEVEEALQRYTSIDGRVTPPSFEELKRMLIYVLDLCPPVLLVIDALDECSNRDAFSRLLHILAIDKSYKVRVLVTSRREIDIERLFKKLPQISVQSHAADQEICQMITTEVNVHPKFQSLGETLKATIITTLSDGAGGM